MNAENDRGAFPELVALGIDAALLAGVQELTAALAPHIHWRDFGRVPGHSASPSRLGSLLRSAPADEYLFLDHSALHASRLAELAERHGARSALIFRLLCLGELIAESELQSLLPAALLRNLIERGLLIRRGAALMLAVRLVPYGDHCYLADSVHLGDNRVRQGIQPTYINFETHAQIRFLRRLTATRRIERSLEVGCGTGIITLELANRVGQREGVDLDARSVAYARLNQRLRADEGAVFRESDLLTAASGHYDLIFFNPFRPTMDSLGFIASFFRQSLDHLAERGVILLVLHALIQDGTDAPWEAISAHLRNELGLSVSRQFIASSVSARRAVSSISFVLVTREEAGRPAKRLRYLRDREYWSWLARRARARLGG